MSIKWSGRTNRSAVEWSTEAAICSVCCFWQSNLSSGGRKWFWKWPKHRVQSKEWSNHGSSQAQSLCKKTVWCLIAVCGRTTLHSTSLTCHISRCLLGRASLHATCTFFPHLTLAHTATPYQTTLYDSYRCRRMGPVLCRYLCCWRCDSSTWVCAFLFQGYCGTALSLWTSLLHQNPRHFLSVGNLALPATSSLGEWSRTLVDSYLWQGGRWRCAFWRFGSCLKVF